MSRKLWIWIIAAAALLGGLLVLVFRAPSIPVEVTQVKQETFEQTIEDDGKTRVRERYVVSAPLAGQLERIKLKPGDAVHAGTPLAVLYPSAPALLDARTVRELGERVGAAEAGLDQSRAEVARTEAALQQAGSDLRRTEKLAQEGFVAPSAREQMELAVRVQTKALESARLFEQTQRDAVDRRRLPLVEPDFGQIIDAREMDGRGQRRHHRDRMPLRDLSLPVAATDSPHCLTGQAAGNTNRGWGADGSPPAPDAEARAGAVPGGGGRGAPGAASAAAADHGAACAGRGVGLDTVLVVQETTTLKFPHPPATDGLAPERKPHAGAVPRVRRHPSPSAWPRSARRARRAGTER